MTVALSARQGIELFHLVLLRARVAKNEGRGLVSLPEAERGGVRDAIVRAMSVSFDDYVSKVVARLESLR